MSSLFIIISKTLFWMWNMAHKCKLGAWKLKKWASNLTDCQSNFHPLDVVDRVSETQPQVSQKQGFSDQRVNQDLVISYDQLIRAWVCEILSNPFSTLFMYYFICCIWIHKKNIIGTFWAFIALLHLTISYNQVIWLNFKALSKYSKYNLNYNPLEVVFRWRSTTSSDWPAPTQGEFGTGSFGRSTHWPRFIHWNDPT